MSSWYPKKIMDFGKSLIENISIDTLTGWILPYRDFMMLSILRIFRIVQLELVLQRNLRSVLIVDHGLH
jgi:hypothetical protein